VRAAQLLDRGFAGNGLTWIRPSLGTVDQLAPIDASPPNLRDEVCSGKRHKPASDDDDSLVAGTAGSSATGDGNNAMFLASGLKAPLPKPSEWLAAAPAPSEPIVVYTGPTRSGPALIAAVAADSASQDAGSKRHGKRSRVASKKPDDAAEPKAADTANAKPKPAAVRHANAKPDTATKPAATDASAAKPAKPKAAAKPKTAPKTSG
jgi:D-alanyl-D-alanine carboxypeptidase